MRVVGCDFFLVFTTPNSQLPTLDPLWEVSKVPIYEYQCSKCGNCFEMIQGASEKESKIACPKCGAAKPQRILSAFSCGGSKAGESGAGASHAHRPGGRYS